MTAVAGICHDGGNMGGIAYHGGIAWVLNREKFLLVVGSTSGISHYKEAYNHYWKKKEESIPEAHTLKLMFVNR